MVFVKFCHSVLETTRNYHNAMAKFGILSLLNFAITLWKFWLSGRPDDITFIFIKININLPLLIRFRDSFYISDRFGTIQNSIWFLIKRKAFSTICFLYVKQHTKFKFEVVFLSIYDHKNCFHYTIFSSLEDFFVDSCFTHL